MLEMKKYPNVVFRACVSATPVHDIDCAVYTSRILFQSCPFGFRHGDPLCNSTNVHPGQGQDILWLPKHLKMDFHSGSQPSAL